MGQTNQVYLSINNNGVRVGWGGGEGEEEACPLETPIFVQRRENHSYKEYAGQHSLVSNVVVPYAKISGKET